jgi:hypothetical protein
MQRKVWRLPGTRATAFLLLLSLNLLEAPASGQTYATITGLVEDASGAVVAGANLTLTNIEQKRPWSTQSNSVGAYTFQQIPPGRYQLDVEAPGFRKFTRSSLTIQVAQVAAIDVTLEVGLLTEVVEVSAETPLLETASSTLGEVVNEVTTENLPLNGRNVLQLIALTPGINTNRNYRSDGSGSGSIASNGFSANGGRNVSNMIMLDGTPQEVMGYNQPAFVPSPDALQEFKVQTNALSAEHGRTGGAVVNLVHRSGTSEFHGVLYEFLRNDKFDSNGFFNNRNGQEKSGFRFNQFGFTLGGPLTPSRQTTFFFVNYEGRRVSNAAAETLSVPTGLMKQGDFSELLDRSLNFNTTDVIYDPLTIDSAGNRQPFPGNMIPKGRHNQVALNFLANYPTATKQGTRLNYFFTDGSNSRRDTFTAKIDRRISERQNLFGRFSWDADDETLPDRYGTAGSWNIGQAGLRNRSVTIDDTYMRGNWILHGNAGIAYHANPRSTPQIDDINQQLGLPAKIDSVRQFPIFPRVDATGYSSLGTDASWIIGNKFYNVIAGGDASRLIGSHTIKFGGAYRLNRVSNFRPVDPNGNYSFNQVWTRRNFASGAGGNSIASMLLGYPTGGVLRTEPSLSLQVRYSALFFQDDWRVNNRLTLNLGMRWERDGPLTEKWDRASWFDTSQRLPLEVPGMGPFFGGLVFAGRYNEFGDSERGIGDLPWTNFSPRAGLAFKVTERLVVRSGFGMFFNPTTGNGPNPTKTGSISFNSSTSVTSSIDGGRTPYATLNDPFPDGFIVPVNAADGLLTSAGQALTVNFRDRYMPYSAQWNFNIQYELGGDMLIDAAYAGNAGVHLQALATQLNQLPDEFLSRGAALRQTVNNPFFGILDPATDVGKRTTTEGQLLRPYPWLSGLTNQLATHAHSSYHAFQLKFRKRYSNGLQFLAGYTFSKTIDDISSLEAFLGHENPGYTNHNDRRLDKSISQIDTPHRLVFNYQWELPFGKGKPLLNSSGVMNQIAGGWIINGVTTIQSGEPMSVTQRTNTLNNFGGTQRPDRTGLPAQTEGSIKKRIDGWINPGAFTDAPEYAYGNMGRFVSDLRGPHYHNWDISILKNFALSERFRLQFRSELFNAFNHTNFDVPGNRTFGEAGFGVITSAQPARIIQFGLKLYY